jgi:hypothetical protein
VFLATFMDIELLQNSAILLIQIRAELLAHNCPNFSKISRLPLEKYSPT